MNCLSTILVIIAFFFVVWLVTSAGLPPATEPMAPEAEGIVDKGGWHHEWYQQEMERINREIERMERHQQGWPGY